MKSCLSWPAKQSITWSLKLTDVLTIECKRCHNSRPETLFSGDDGYCAYCVADMQDKMPDPESRPVDHEPGTVSPEELAKQELAARFLTRRRLLPFIERNNPDYHAGWVHKDICRRLEQFSEDVVNKKSPRLILQMPPRLGKSTIASAGFPAWHIGRNPSHEFISCSYSGALAMTFSRKVRSMLRETSYKTTFKT